MINWISISIPYPSLEFWTLYLCLGSVSMMVVLFRAAWVTGGKSQFLELSFKEQLHTMALCWILWPLHLFVVWPLLTRKNHDEYMNIDDFEDDI